LIRVAGLVLALFVAAGAAGADDLRNGPLEWREHWLLAQGRLTLPPASPRTVPRGLTVVSIDLDWGNDLGWDQPEAGESDEGRLFLVDGEHRTLALDVRHGLAHRLDVGFRIPLEWRGGGSLDGLIDWFHGFTRKLGLPDNGRRAFERDLLRIDLRRDGEPLPLDDRPGAGLGRAEVFARWALHDGAAAGSALVVRLALPTGTGPFASGGAALGLQLVGGRALGGSAAAFAGLGATIGPGRADGPVDVAIVRPEGFLALERGLSRRWSIVAQSNAAGRLVTNVDRYPSIQWYLSLGGRLQLDAGWMFEGGFTENIASQQGTTDFGIQLRVARSLGRRR
jgi:hypothetical protein